jgi:hypothetical protein
MCTASNVLLNSTSWGSRSNITPGIAIVTIQGFVMASKTIFQAVTCTAILAQKKERKNRLALQF